MFQAFLEKYKLSDFEFSADLFPTAENRTFWDAFPSGSMITEAEAAHDLLYKGKNIGKVVLTVTE